MQKISISNLKSGMIIDKSIFDDNGTLLLGAGTTINNKIINRLISYNLSSVYIKNPLTGLGDAQMEENAETMPDIILEETRRKAVETMRTSFSGSSSSVIIDTGRIKKVAEFLIDEILKNGEAMIHLSDIRIYDDQTFAHSVNVAAITAMLGMKLGYNIKQLFELATGALLHDVGKMLLPPEILTKRGKLTEEEYDLVKQHPVWGFEILRKNKELSLLSAHVAYQHHEKFDGNGYTRSMKGKDIHEYARIVAIADVYEALSSDRYYRKAFMPHEVYEMMLAMSGTHFDQEFLMPFLNNLIIYPIGTVVVLSNGMLSLVEKIFPGLQLRPIVRVIAEKEDSPLLDKSFSLDLGKNLNITIAKVLPEEEICKLIQTYQKQFN